MKQTKHNGKALDFSSVNKASQDLDSDLARSLTSFGQRSHFPFSVNFPICKNRGKRKRD